MLNTKEYFNQLDATLAVKEISDEAASTCSGGLAPVSLYANEDYEGEEFKVYENDDNLDNRKFGVGKDFNNKTSSIIVRRGTWQIYSKDGYDGTSKTLYAGRKYSTSSAFGLADNSLTGIRRIED